jgi:hypothetical protein
LISHQYLSRENETASQKPILAGIGILDNIASAFPKHHSTKDDDDNNHCARTY